MYLKILKNATNIKPIKSPANKISKKLPVSSDSTKAPKINQKINTNKSGLVIENQYLDHIPIHLAYAYA
jgi:hypothetical protein